MKSKEWQEILNRVNSADGLNSDTVIDKIKEILEVEYPGIYERWGEDAYEGWGEDAYEGWGEEELKFDIDYLFQYAELRQQKYMFTLLHASVTYNLINILNALLAAGANIHARDKYEDTPLHLAALFGYVDIVNVLLENGAEVNVKGRHKKTPLHWAAQNGYIEIIEILLKSGANINAITKDQETPLHYAALAGYADTVNVLLKNGAEVNARDKHNKTALHWAAGSEHIDVVRVLLQNKATPSLKDSHHQTPISLTWDDEIKHLLQDVDRRNITTRAMPIALIMTAIAVLAVFIAFGTFAYTTFEPSTEVDKVKISDKVSNITESERNYTKKFGKY